MQLIGVEEHFLTPEVAQAWHAMGLAAIDPSVGANGGPFEARLMNLAEHRISLMDETGLDIQVLSLTTPSLHDFGADGIEIARRTNDAVAAAIARHPTRFQGFATLPVSQPDEAALELQRCIHELGFKGTMLCGRVGNHNLDAPFLAPIFECASRLGAPILLHPRMPTPAVRQAYYSGFHPELEAAFAAYGLGWHYDAGIQFLRLVLSGTFDRLPDLQVILGHWGEVVLFYVERLAVMDHVSRLEHPIVTYLRRNLYVTASGMYLPHYLERARAVVGADRLLFSTDFPYPYQPGGLARQFLDNCGLEGTDKAAFAHGNWQRLTQKLTMRENNDSR